MYVSAPAVTAARLATIEHCGQASMLLLESTGRLADLYAGMGRYVFAMTGESHRRHEVGLADPWLLPVLCGELAVRQGPELFGEHVDVLGKTYEQLVRVFEALLHTATGLTRHALETAAWSAPPVLEPGLDSAISAIEAGEALADDLAEASVAACDKVEQVLEQRIRRRG